MKPHDFRARKMSVIPGEPCASTAREGDPGVRNQKTEAGNQNADSLQFQTSNSQHLVPLPLALLKQRSAGDDTDGFASSGKTNFAILDSLPEPHAFHSRIPLGHCGADACLKGGLAPGALHEIFAAEAGCEGAASGFAAALAARVAQNKTLLWIRQDFSALEFGDLSATGLLELGLDPARVLLLKVSDVTSALRAAGDALSCSALGAVIIEIPGAQKKLDLVTSRRLTLAAAKKGVTPFLLRFAAKPDASSAETRWMIGPAPSAIGNDDWGFAAFAAALVRNRHGATGNWVMEWNGDEQCFRAADRGAVVPISGDGPAQRQATA